MSKKILAKILAYIIARNGLFKNERTTLGYFLCLHNIIKQVCKCLLGPWLWKAKYKLVTSLYIIWVYKMLIFFQSLFNIPHILLNCLLVMMQTNRDLFVGPRWHILILWVLMFFSVVTILSKAEGWPVDVYMVITTLTCMCAVRGACVLLRVRGSWFKSAT